MSEEYDKVEKYLMQEIKKRGGRCIKLTPPPNGIPDRLILMPNGVAVFAETKTIKGRLKVNQKRRISELQELDFVVVVIYSRDDVDNLMVFLSQAVGSER